MNSFRFPYSLTVFFPAYNDAPSLPKLVDTTFATLESHVDDFEVIVVDDGSADNTEEVLRDLKRQHGPRLKVVSHRINRGYGGALRSGFAAATKDFVFYTDGDGQYDVSQIPDLLRHAAPDVGLVNGFKIKRHDPWHRIVIGALYNQFARRLFRVRLRDIDCDYRLIRNAMLTSINLTCTSGTICVELVKKIEATGTRVIEVPVNHLAREHGRSQFFRIRSLATTFVQLLDLHRKLVLRPWLQALRQRLTRLSMASHS